MDHVFKWYDMQTLLQRVNRWLHADPIATLVSVSFWSFLLIWVAPSLGWILFFKNVAYTVDAALRFILGIPMKREDGRCNASLSKELGEKELAIAITGCDSGLGRDLAYTLADRGFVVFAACNTQEGRKQFLSKKKQIFAVKCDVTVEEDIDLFSGLVSSWLKYNSDDASSIRSTRLPRYLHAVINNAGSVTTTSKGYSGVADWLDISEYRNTMEVNFFGQVAVTKAFLPILKSQNHIGTRIINMSSVAGLLSGVGPSAYSASKFAMESFADTLRLELKNFGIYVVNVNPSFHRSTQQKAATPSKAMYIYATGSSPNSPTQVDDIRNMDSTNRSSNQYYPQEYYSPFKTQNQSDHEFNNTIFWEQTVLINEVVSCVELSKPPPRVIVGSDAKFFFYPLRLLPSSMQLKLINVFTVMMEKLKLC